MNALDLRVSSNQTICSPNRPLLDIIKSARPQMTSDTILPDAARGYLPNTTECPPFICRTCDKSFTEASVLYDHEGIHAEMYDEKFAEMEVKNYSSNRNRKRSSIDVEGVKEFRHASDLHTDQFIENGKHRFVCEICDERFNDALNLQKHYCNRCSGEERPFVCVKNGKVCDSNIVNNHELLIGNALPHSCGKCDKSFPDTIQLQSHELIHIGTRPFMCNTCNRRFTQAGHLRRHELSHTGDCPFVCKTCNLRFTLEKNLLKHELKHDRERPFACETCDEKFTEEVLLRTHELSHVVQRTYVCETCRKSFTQAGSLRRHERIHLGQQPYICGDCNKRFTREENLTRHMFLHTGERPFVCTTCSASFAQAGTLQRHERRHCGERMFDCKKCDKTCCGLSALRAHQYAHTREENLSGVLVSPREKQSDERGRIKKRSLHPYLTEYPGHHYNADEMRENGLEYSGQYTEEQIGDLIRSEHESLTRNYRRQMAEGRFYEEEEGEEHKFGCGICGEMFFTRLDAKSCFYQHSPHTSDDVSAMEADRMELADTFE